MDTDLGPIDRRLRNSDRTRKDETLGLLASIDDALDRLDDGSFGYCETCGSQIELARLVDNPAISKCKTCED